MKNKHLLDYLIARLQQEWSWQLLTILFENLMFAQTNSLDYIILAKTQN